MHACTRTGRHYNPDTITTAPRRVRFNMALRPRVARESIAHYIACTDQPINFGDNVFYEEFIQTAFNPQFQTVSRNTTRNDLIKCFETQ